MLGWVGSAGNAANAAMTLDKLGVVRYDRAMDDFVPTELGRIKSHFYITCDTVSISNSPTLWYFSKNVRNFIEKIVFLNMQNCYSQLLKPHLYEMKQLREC
jgi:hypothetical protein